MKNKILILLIFGMILFSVASINAFNWSDGIVSYYKLDNTTGAVYDMLENNHGDNFGATRGVTGIINNAFDFERSETDYFNPNITWNAGTTDFTFSFWFKPESLTDEQALISTDISNTAPRGFQFISHSNELLLYDGNTQFIQTSGNPLTTGNWHHVVITQTGTSGKIYVDGVLNKSGTSNFNSVNNELLFGQRSETNPYSFTDGIWDEILVLDRAANSTEILELYNYGLSLGYGEQPSIISVTLISPINGTIISTVGENFTASYESPSNLTNATYFIWDDEGAIFNQTTITITGVSNNTTLYIDEFIVGSYEWNVLGCNEDNCTFADDNFTLTVGATIDNEIYSNYTYETSTETFEINISLLTGSTLYDAQLIYNGTSYEGEMTLISTEKYSIIATIDIPLINSSSEIKDFFWQLIFPVGGEAFTYQNLTSHEQNVSQIQLGSCAGALTSLTLNFTNWDEENRTILTSFDFHGTFLYWLGSGSTYKNFSISNTNITNQTICILPSNLTYHSDAQIQYEKSAYVKRNYYLINATLTNTTQNIKLFSLLTSSATTFILEVIDESIIPVVDAYLYIQRYYAGAGIFETIAMAKTDITGSTVAHFEKDTEDYKIIIFKDGEILFESETQKIFCRESPCTVSFQVEAAVGAVWNDFGDVASLIWSLEFNENTNIWTYTYVDTSGATQYGRLFVYYEKGTGKVTICNTTSSSASATITCNVTGYEGTIYAAGYISRSPEILIYLKTAVVKTIKAILGMEGLFLSMFVLLFLGLIGLWNPVVGIISLVGGMVILNFMGLASFGAVTIWGVIFIALILLWELKGS